MPWPGYRRMDEINAKALEMGHGRNGCYDFLYDESHFFAVEPLREKFVERNRGSLALQLRKLS